MPNHDTFRTVLKCVLCLAAFGLLASVPPGVSAPADPARADAVLSHIEWFGFVGIDAGIDDPIDPDTTTNYLHEISPFCNLAHLAPFVPAEDISHRIDAMSAAGVAPMLDVQHILFDSIPDATAPSGDRLVLRPNHRQRLQTLIAGSALTPRLDVLASVYIVDEPSWRGLPAQDLAAAASTVRDLMPGIPISFVEAAPVVAQMSVPIDVDWVGFDLYAVGDPSTDPTYLNTLELLRQKRSRPDQRIMLVFESQWLPIYTQLGYQPEIMAAIFDNYTRLAARSPDVVAMIGYTWAGGLDGPSHLGARSLPPSVRARYSRFGERFR